MERDAAAIALWPWALWRAQVDAWAMMAGAAEVIAVRAPIIGRAMVDPLSADRRELTVMVSEKVAASMGSHRRARGLGLAVARALRLRWRMGQAVAQGHWPQMAHWVALGRADLAVGAALVDWPGGMVDPFARRVRANVRRLRLRKC